MEVEPGCAVNFFAEEGITGVEIIDRLNQHYDGDAPQRMQVYYWIKEVKSGRKDLSNVPPLGRPSGAGKYYLCPLPSDGSWFGHLIYCIAASTDGII
jgi:hypothetical protein